MVCISTLCALCNNKSTEKSSCNKTLLEKNVRIKTAPQVHCTLERCHNGRHAGDMYSVLGITYNSVLVVE